MNKYEKFTADLLQAIALSDKLRNTTDNGSCNFDSPAIMIDGYKQTELEKAIAAAGCRCYDWKLTSKEKALVIYGFTAGQADRRSLMAECAYKHLKFLGYPMMMYYQMD